MVITNPYFINYRLKWSKIFHGQIILKQYNSGHQRTHTHIHEHIVLIPSMFNSYYLRTIYLYSTFSHTTERKKAEHLQTKGTMCGHIVRTVIILKKINRQKLAQWTNTTRNQKNWINNLLNKMHEMKTFVPFFPLKNKKDHLITWISKLDDSEQINHYFYCSFFQGNYLLDFFFGIIILEKKHLKKQIIVYWLMVKLY